MTEPTKPASSEAWMKRLKPLRRTSNPAVEAGLCEIVIEPDATIDEIIAVFQKPEYRDRISVFHFAGHAGSFHLCMETAEGKVEMAHAGGLASFLGLQKNLQLVFLNGCSTQRQTDELLEARVGAVIATSQVISDEVATDLSGRFYQSLASGKGVYAAFQEALAAVQLKKGTDFRSLVWQDAEENVDRFPWDFYLGPGAELVKKWNLPDAAGNPLFALPALSDQPLPESPFRYLEWFREEDAAIFFGRAYQIRELYDLVNSPETSSMIHLYGRSGVGKSSLLAAGLTPRLRQDYQVTYIRRDASLGLLGSLIQGLKADGDLVSHWLKLEEEKPLVVVLDQVEEVFTRANSSLPNELTDLTEALEQLFFGETIPQGKIILSYRKEYLAEIEEHFRQTRLPHEKVFLEKLKRNDIMEAVRGLTRSVRTIEKYQLSIAPPPPDMASLPEVIADDLLEDTDSPIAPVLQILLSNMWLAAKTENTDQPVFSHEIYQSQKQRGIWMGDFLKNQLKKLYDKNPAPIESGLAIDLMVFHTTSLGTATSRTVAEIREMYVAQTEEIEKLLAELKDLYVLIDPQSDGEKTRLAHDTLAPLVLQRYNESNAPGQQALRTIQSRLLFNSDPDQIQALQIPDIELIEAGLSGRRKMDSDEEHLLWASKAKYPDLGSPTVNFNLAMQAFAVKEDLLSREAVIKSWHQGIHFKKGKYIDTAFVFYINEGKQTVAVDRDNMMRVGDAESPVFKIEKAKTVFPVPRTNSLISIDQDENIYVWELGKGLVCKVENLFEAGGGRYRSGKVATKMKAFGLGAEQLLDAKFNREKDKLIAVTREEGIKVFDKKGEKLEAYPADFSSIVMARYVARWDSVLNLLESGEIILKKVGLEKSYKLGKTSADIDDIIFSPDESQVVLTADNQLFLIDIQEATLDSQDRELQGRELGQNISELAFSPDNERLIIAFENETCGLYDRKLNQLATLEGFEGPVEYLEFHPSGEEILMLADGEVYTWDLAINDFLFTREYRYRVNCIEYAATEEKYFYAQGALFGVAHFDDWRRDVSQRLEEGWVRAGTFSPDGEKIVVGGENACVYIYQYASPAEPITIKGMRAEELRERVQEKLYGMDQMSLESLPETIDEKRTSDFNPKQEFEDLIADIKGHLGEITDVKASPDGKYLATTSTDSFIKIWDWQGKKHAEMKGSKSLGDIQDLVDTGFQGLVIQQNQRSMSSSFFEKEIEQISEADPLKAIGHTETVNCLAFSPDSKNIYSVSDDGTLRKWTIDGKLRWTIMACERGVNRVVVGQKGKYLYTGDQNGNLICWDREGKQIWAQKAHKSRFTALEVSPDRQQLVSAGTDRQVFIWTIEGEKFAELEGHTAEVNDLTFSRDGKQILTASDDQTIRKWLIDLEEIKKKGEGFRLKSTKTTPSPFHF
jgi:WD40 repeat protein